jgi:hypothetical protein
MDAKTLIVGDRLESRRFPANQSGGNVVVF